MNRITNINGSPAPVGSAQSLPATHTETAGLEQHRRELKQAGHQQRLTRKALRAKTLIATLNFRRRSRQLSFEQNDLDYDNGDEDFRRRLGLREADQQNRGGGGGQSGEDASQHGQGGAEEAGLEPGRPMSRGGARAAAVQSQGMSQLADKFVGSDEARESAVRRAALKHIAELARAADDSRPVAPELLAHLADRLAVQERFGLVAPVRLDGIRELLIEEGSLKQPNGSQQGGDLRRLLPLLLLAAERPRTSAELTQARVRLSILAHSRPLRKQP